MSVCKAHTAQRTYPAGLIALSGQSYSRWGFITRPNKKILPADSDRILTIPSKDA